MEFAPTVSLDQSRVILPQGTKFGERLVCAICIHIPVDAVECDYCQNLFCSRCLNQWLCRKLECPNRCPQPFNQVHPHKIVRDALASLRFTCINRRQGCKKVLKMSEVATHEKTCDAQEMVCKHSKCGMRFLVRDRNKHEKTECLYRTVACVRCKETYVLKHQKEHDCVKALLKRVDSLTKEVDDYKKQTKSKLVHLESMIAKNENVCKKIQADARAPIRNQAVDEDVENRINRFEDDVGHLSQKLEVLEQAMFGVRDGQRRVMKENVDHKKKAAPAPYAQGLMPRESLNTNWDTFQKAQSKTSWFAAHNVALSTLPAISLSLSLSLLPM
eukprot:TRINITY_DN5680_c0_g2_i1.p1 TRINITY_DN5680_c0_g2~~TRINITY_DN5680_c0_g2_i1.p1  ORF type:complete len:330 (+),score=51.81 TRINITY_DN5680_c0_g2_i1:1073-2062(+)